jgi:hypothetical protein
MEGDPAVDEGGPRTDEMRRVGHELGQRRTDDRSQQVPAAAEWTD